MPGARGTGAHNAEMARMRERTQKSQPRNRRPQLSRTANPRGAAQNQGKSVSAELPTMLRLLAGRWRCGAAILEFSGNNPHVTVTPDGCEPYDRALRLLSRTKNEWQCVIGTALYASSSTDHP
jgi:hypothetical protein